MCFNKCWLIFKLPKPAAAAAAIIPTSVQSKTPTTQSSPPLYATSAAQNINIDSIRRQEEELARKAAELDRKEQALRNVEAGTGKLRISL